ncbi:MAG: inorganic diphosphatase [Patescibacteria group bacterium]|nr:inorganic diphosphatase [Patescibacteria group bacterium]
MNLFKDISCGKNPPQEISVVVEIAKGTQNKIEYDEEKGFMALDRTLYSPLVYPFEYGFIPQTRSEDGDSLDIILLATNPTFAGCVVKARPVAVMLMEDEGGTDNKIIAAPMEKLDPRFKEIQDVDDFSEHLRKEIQEFFEVMKRLEPNKWVKVKGWEGKEKAMAIIKQAAEKYQAETKI